METKETLKEQYRQMFPDWPEKRLEEYAGMMAAKYSTIKQGPDVIHLDYYSGLLDTADIESIENSLALPGYRLSRFDKSGVPYASIDEFTLHIAILLSTPVVQSILLGLGTNALWDAIKSSSLHIWKRVKERVSDSPAEKRRATINFGIKAKINEKVSIDLKLNGEMNEQTAMQALDKMLEVFERTIETANKPVHKFLVYNASKRLWEEIDVKEELFKIASKKSKNK